MFCYTTITSTLTRCSRCTKPLSLLYHHRNFSNQLSRTLQSSVIISQYPHRAIVQQSSRTFHTSHTLQLSKSPATPRDPFDPIVADDNVVGLVHPEMMNRMKTRYPMMWLLNSSMAGTGLLCFTSSNGMVPALGMVLIFSSLLFTATMWYNAMCIGKISLNQDTTATLSHLNMFGRRVDKTVPLSSLQLMTKLDHKQWIDGKLYYINWDQFKANDRLWENAIPAQKPHVLIPENVYRNRK